MLEEHLQSLTSIDIINLRCATPQAWLDRACDHLPELLSDHANCERKAAAMAMSLMKYFSHDVPVLNRLSKIAREELVHYEQVLGLMKKVNIAYKLVSASTYARDLWQQACADPEGRLLDQLIICAIIEARSCERFSCLVPILPEPLSSYYHKLYQAEKRHAIVYLDLARSRFDESVIATRLDHFVQVEADAMQKVTPHFRFHSGIPS